MTHTSPRAYRTQVARIVRLTPHFARITLAGPELAHVGAPGLDQRIKLLLPQDDGRYADIGLFDDPAPAGAVWYARWRALPDAERNPLRTYTLRAARPDACEIDVDFVLHGTDGPASAWADAAAVGDPIVVIAPDRRAEDLGRGGVEWHPGRARTVLLAGDETAAPAICAIVEQLGPEVDGLALIEVPDGADALPVPTRSGVQVRWLPRDGGVHGCALTPAVEQWGRERAARLTGSGAEGPPTADLGEPGPDDILWEAPEDGTGTEYAWLAGEAGVITGLRRHLVRDLGIDRKAVAFMGYWRLGRAEGA